MTRVLLFGSAPPPQGGIQQHGVRLLGYLREQGLDAVLLDYNGRHRSEGVHPISKGFVNTIRAVRKHQPDIIHSHAYHWATNIAIGLLGRMGVCKTVVTIHGESFFDGVKPWVLPALKQAMRQFDAVIADNDLLRAWAVDEAGVDPTRVVVDHAFLPPTRAQQSPELLPDEVQQFLNAHHPTLLVNGKIATFRGQDKYGIRHAVAAAAQLKEKYPRLGLIFVLTNIQHSKEEKVLRKAIADADLGNAFLWVEGLPELVPLIAKSDVLLRPTATDGDSLIVREGLMANTPVVATDVVKRPAGVRCFSYGDVDGLADQVSAALEADPNLTATPQQPVHVGNAILDIYTQALATPTRR
ncbi:MAG: glycosyltransferase family 4 protein [Myxococcota bacterium]|nr:glycosyltransferase family 4 protein [Myxococcota bacterium]